MKKRIPSIALTVATVGVIGIAICRRKRIKTATDQNNNRILILVNHDVVIYNFRLELVERLLAEDYEVHISSPYGDRIDDLVAIGAKYHSITMDRHGMNPKEELSIFNHYRDLIKEVDPRIVLGFTIKPNIYGALASRIAGIPFVANITGLGTAVENGGIQQKVTVIMYRIAFGTHHGKIQRVFFQNNDNEEFFRKQRIALDKHKILPGSGVNLERYPFTLLPMCGNGKEGIPVRFAFISRIMKEKGIDQYLEAAEVIKKLYPTTEFHVCGFCEPEYDGRLNELDRAGVVEYHGMIRDVAGFMSKMHCIVHPTYYPEGLSNVLLEASSCGRPIITCNRSGCREVVDGNGYLVFERDTDSLIGALKQFINLSQGEKQAMGKRGRQIVEENFNRRIIIEAYMREIRLGMIR